MPTQPAGRTLQPSGGFPALALASARLQCHHAAQLAVSLAISLLTKRDDDSHTNLGWEPSLAGLTTHPLPGRVPFRAGVIIPTLELVVTGEGVHQRFGLAGRTIAEGWAWIGEAARAAGAAGTLTDARHYTIPTHPVAEGGRFALEPAAAFAELAAWYALAERVLRALAARTDGASDVRCWPHHFDLATLIMLPARGDTARTVGVGLSPGDDSYPVPYFYVTPYPYPSPDRLGPLSLGAWHTTGWTGAVITGEELVRGGNTESRAARFVDEAVAAATRAL